MLGLLLRVAVGVVFGAATAYAGYTVYKKITKKELVKEATKKIMDNDLFQDALKAKITAIEKSGCVITLDILDNFDKPILEDVDVHGEEIDNNIKIGQEIMLYD